MTTMNVSLPAPLKSWVETRLQDGSFSNTSDYVRHLIRKDQERQQAIQTLQGAIDQAVRSGAPEAFDFKAFKARMRGRHAGT